MRLAQRKKKERKALERRTGIKRSAEQGLGNRGQERRNPRATRERLGRADVRATEGKSERMRRC